MVKKVELQEFIDIDIDNLSTEELFELKRKYDEWWEKALARVNNIDKPKDK